MENQAIQNPTPEPTLTPVQVSEPKVKFPVMYLVLSLFVLVLLASTVFLYYQNIQLKSMLASYQTQPVISPTPATYQSPIPSNTTNSTVNWKTYINNKYKYEIKFPSLWEYNRGPGNTSDAELSNQRDIDIYEPNLPSGNPGTGITIKVNELDAQGNSKNCTTLEDCIEKSFSWLPKTQEIENGETTFLGQRAKTIKYTRITPLYSQTWKYVFVILNNNFYSFSLSSETKGFDNNLIIFNQVLSMFKFTN